MLAADGRSKDFVLTDYALHQWREASGASSGLPKGFVTAADLPVRAHLDMLAALQPFVDNSISKTVNVSPDLPFSEFEQIYDRAYDMGLKGCTTFRPNPVTGTVLRETATEAPHCRAPEREAD